MGGSLDVTYIHTLHLTNIPYIWINNVMLITMYLTNISCDALFSQGVTSSRAELAAQFLAMVNLPGNLYIYMLV